MSKSKTKQYLTDDLIQGMRKRGVFNESSPRNTKIWSDLIKDYYLPDEMLLDYYFKIDWSSAAMHQILSEELILKIDSKIRLDYFVWEKLYKYQNLSYDFMHRNRSKLNFEDDIVLSGCINNMSKIPNKLTDFLFKEFRAGLWDDVLFSTVDIRNEQYLKEVEKIQEERLNASLSSSGLDSVYKRQQEIEDDDFKLS